MVSISRSLPAPVARPEPVHYQTYLAPILHKKFAKTWLFGAGAAYAGAVLVGKGNSFWSYTPLSWTIVGWMFIFLLTITPILVIRIGQLHLTARPQTSTFHGIRMSLGSISTYVTFGAYILASVSFVAVYLCSRTKQDKLNVLTEARSYARPQLNERFLYMYFFAFFSGVVQAVHHVLFDKAKLELCDNTKEPNDIISDSILPCARNAVKLTLISVFFGPVFYLPFRQTIWDVALSITRTFYWINRNSALHGWPVGLGLTIRCLFVGFCLIFMIEVSSAAFTAYFSSYPFPDNLTISDKSADANGTLLTGLRSASRPMTQTLAFWELAVVSKTRSDRRKLIFTDVRKPSKMWDLILNECLQVLSDAEIALSKAMSSQPPAPQPSPAPSISSTAIVPVSTPPAIQFSPKPAVVERQSPKARKFVESIQSSDERSPLSTVAERLPDVKVVAQPAVSAAVEKLLPYIQSDMGTPFRQTIQNTAARVLPNVKIQIYAVSALTSLICASLDEDEYGVVQKNVPAVLGAFYSTYSALQRFVANPPLHWTDVEAQAAGPNLKLEEPEALIESLKHGICGIITAFKPYLNDILEPDLAKKLKIMHEETEAEREK